MNISEYVDLVFTKNDLFLDIKCEGTEEEQESLKRICDINIERERLIMAWETIISCVIEKYNNCTTVYFFSDKVLRFLIDNKLCLVTLGHLRLKDDWLKEILKKDKSIYEAEMNIRDKTS